MKRTLKVESMWACLCFFIAFISSIQSALAAEERKEILIGSHLPMSGMGAMSGKEQKWAYEQALKDINQAGGIYVREYGKKLPVRLVLIDDESDSEKAAVAVERLIKQDKVDLILSGQVGAMGVIPGMITAEKYKKYYHGTVVWIPNFLEHNFKYCTMYFFDMGQAGSMTFDLWKSLPEDQRPRKIGLFLEDSFDGELMGDAWAQFAKKNGFEVVARESLSMGGKDFTSQVLKGKAAGVDAIVCMANVPETVILVRQMKQNNFNVKYFQGMKGTWANDFYEALKKDSDYILCDGFWSMDFPFKGAKELGERYIKDHGKSALGIGLYYGVCQILWDAIEKAGTLDSLKVRQAVLDNKCDTVMGKVEYDRRGIAVFRLANFQWKDGKRNVIYPLDLTTCKVQPAPPWDKR